MENQTLKTALITGATSGIGRELANLFAKDGYNLVLVARSKDRLHQIAEEYEQQFEIKVTAIAKDLVDPKAPEEIYNETRRRGIAIDVLVNNAGIGEYGLFAQETDLNKELGIIQLNISSLVHLTKLYIRDMTIRNEGKILMLGSVSSVLSTPMMAVYGATKSFILSFSEALRNELKGTNVTITALMPGVTNTDFFTKAGAEGTRAHQQAQAIDPAKVAKHGYDALMKGKDKVVSGFMNKAQVAISHVLPATVVSEAVRRQMERPLEESKEDKSTALLVAALAVGFVATTALVWVFSKRDESWYDAQLISKKAKSVKDKILDTLSLN